MNDLDFKTVGPRKVTPYYLMDDAAMAEVDYLKAIYKKFVAHLADKYRNGQSVEIAGLCDETLDRSGRLLGEVRKASGWDCWKQP